MMINLTNFFPNRSCFFPFLFFLFFFSFFFFFVTWDGRFNIKEDKQKFYLIKSKEYRTWDGVENRL